MNCDVKQNRSVPKKNSNPFRPKVLSRVLHPIPFQTTVGTAGPLNPVGPAQETPLVM